MLHHFPSTPCCCPLLSHMPHSPLFLVLFPIHAMLLPLAFSCPLPLALAATPSHTPYTHPPPTHTHREGLLVTLCSAPLSAWHLAVATPPGQLALLQRDVIAEDALPTSMRARALAAVERGEGQGQGQGGGGGAGGACT